MMTSRVLKSLCGGALAVVMTAAVGPEKLAFGCASCGSGGDDPMILYPNETNKFYLGLSENHGIRNVNDDGDLVASGGPTRKQTMTFSYGRAFNNRSFATLTVPVQRNEGTDDARTAVGDPSLAMRYTALMQNMAEPWLPQIQLVAGYKHAQATSIHDTKKVDTLVDVFGNGFSEAKAGVDVWYGQSDLKLGVAYTYSMPFERSFEGINFAPGRAHRATASAGYMVTNMWKLTGGLNRTARGSLRQDGRVQAATNALNHSAFISVDWLPSVSEDVRLSFSRQAAAFKNHNTDRSDTVSLAYMKAI